MWSMIRGGQDDSIVGWRCIQQKGEVQLFWLVGGTPHLQFRPLLGHPNLPIKKTLRRVLGLLTVMILKRVRESIFFQSNKFTTCKIKDGKVVEDFLMGFNLLKIIHSF